MCCCWSSFASGFGGRLFFVICSTPKNNKLCVIFSSSTSTLRIIGVTIFFDSGGVGVDADKEEEEEDKEEEDKEEEDKEGNWRRRPTDGQKRRKSSWFGKKNALGTQNDDDDDAALDERR